MSCFSFYITIIDFSLHPQLLRKFSLLLLIYLLMSLYLISVYRSIQFSFLLQLKLSSFKLSNTLLLLILLLKLLMHILMSRKLRLMLPLNFLLFAFIFCSLLSSLHLLSFLELLSLNNLITLSFMFLHLLLL